MSEALALRDTFRDKKIAVSLKKASVGISRKVLELIPHTLLFIALNERAVDVTGITFAEVNNPF